MRFCFTWRVFFLIIMLVRSALSLDSHYRRGRLKRGGKSIVGSQGARRVSLMQGRYR